MPSKAERVIGALRRMAGNRGAQRAERAFDEVPNLERKFTEDALIEALTSPDTLLSPIKPSNFGRLSQQLFPEDLAKLPSKLDSLTSAYDSPTFEGWHEVPHLGVVLHEGKSGPTDVAQVLSHEGRHRNAVQARKGDEDTLVRLWLMKSAGDLEDDSYDAVFPDFEPGSEEADKWLQELLLRRLIRPEMSVLEKPPGLSDLDRDRFYLGHAATDVQDPPGRERMRLLDIIKPFRRGGLAQMRNC